MTSHHQQRKDLKISGTAIVCSEAELVGNVTIGPRTVVQPAAKIIAEGGPVIIGEGNLIMERCVIINRKKEGSDEKTMVIGDGNVFEFDSKCESLNIGNDNVLEAKSFVGPGVSITSHCVVGAKCSLDSQETLAEQTIICGSDQKRHTRLSSIATNNSQQLDYLIKLLPNFHKLQKSQTT